MRIEHQTWGLPISWRDKNVLTLPLQMRLRINENMVWTDSQDYGVDEILHISKKTLFCKITRITSEITTLFRVPPQLFTLFRVPPQLFQPQPKQYTHKKWTITFAFPTTAFCKKYDVFNRLYRHRTRKSHFRR